MTRQSIIDKTIKAINHLPVEKAEVISDFADFVLNRYEERVLIEGIVSLTSTSRAFDFLNDDEDIYTEGDIKEPYNG